MFRIRNSIGSVDIIKDDELPDVTKQEITFWSHKLNVTPSQLFSMPKDELDTILNNYLSAKKKAQKTQKESECADQVKQAAEKIFELGGGTRLTGGQRRRPYWEILAQAAEEIITRYGFIWDGNDLVDPNEAFIEDEEGEEPNFNIGEHIFNASANEYFDEPSFNIGNNMQSSRYDAPPHRILNVSPNIIYNISPNASHVDITEANISVGNGSYVAGENRNASFLNLPPMDRMHSTSIADNDPSFMGTTSCLDEDLPPMGNLQSTGILDDPTPPDYNPNESTISQRIELLHMDFPRVIPFDPAAVGLNEGMSNIVDYVIEFGPNGSRETTNNITIEHVNGEGRVTASVRSFDLPGANSVADALQMAVLFPPGLVDPNVLGELDEAAGGFTPPSLPSLPRIEAITPPANFGNVSGTRQRTPMIEATTPPANFGNVSGARARTPLIEATTPPQNLCNVSGARARTPLIEATTPPQNLCNVSGARARTPLIEGTTPPQNFCNVSGARARTPLIEATSPPQNLCNVSGARARTPLIEGTTPPQNFCNVSGARARTPLIEATTPPQNLCNVSGARARTPLIEGTTPPQNFCNVSGARQRDSWIQETTPPPNFWNASANRARTPLIEATTPPNFWNETVITPGQERNRPPPSWLQRNNSPTGPSRLQRSCSPPGPSGLQRSIGSTTPPPNFCNVSGARARTPLIEGTTPPQNFCNVSGARARTPMIEATTPPQNFCNVSGARARTPMIEATTPPQNICNVSGARQRDSWIQETTPPPNFWNASANRARTPLIEATTPPNFWNETVITPGQERNRPPPSWLQRNNSPPGPSRLQRSCSPPGPSGLQRSIGSTTPPPNLCNVSGARQTTSMIEATTPPANLCNVSPTRPRAPSFEANTPPPNLWTVSPELQRSRSPTRPYGLPITPPPRFQRSRSPPRPSGFLSQREQPCGNPPPLPPPLSPIVSPMSPVFPAVPVPLPRRSRAQRRQRAIDELQFSSPTRANRTAARRCNLSGIQEEQSSAMASLIDAITPPQNFHNISPARANTPLIEATTPPANLCNVSPTRPRAPSFEANTPPPNLWTVSPEQQRSRSPTRPYGLPITPPPGFQRSRSPPGPSGFLRQCEQPRRSPPPLPPPLAPIVSPGSPVYPAVSAPLPCRTQEEQSSLFEANTPPPNLWTVSPEASGVQRSCSPPRPSGLQRQEFGNPPPLPAPLSPIVSPMSPVFPAVPVPRPRLSRTFMRERAMDELQFAGRTRPHRPAVVTRDYNLPGILEGQVCSPRRQFSRRRQRR